MPLSYVLAGLAMVLVTAGAVAAGGPALAQLRTTLPAAGEVLVDHEDATTLRTNLAEGSKSEIVTVEKSAEMPLEKALRVRVPRAYDTPYRVQILSTPFQSAVKKGDTLILQCWMRNPEAVGGRSGLATIYVQATGPNWSSPANVSATCGQSWRLVYASGTAQRDYPAGGLEVTFHIAQQEQVLDVAGLVVVNLGQNVDIARLPRNSVTWVGMEANAPWRAAAQKRIEQHRMADLTVQVLDASGKPVANAPVHVQQQKRAFTIGSFTGYKICEDNPDGQKMREVFTKLFNRATSPIYWADWGWPKQKPKYLEIGKWLTDHGFTVRGHVMIYPGWKFMPAEVVKLKDKPEELRARTLQQVREISEATKPFNFREYDVTNELRDLPELHTLLGREVVAEWFAEARRHLPNAKLAINENSILTHSGATKANQDLYLDWYRYLKSKGVAPDVIGFQGHFGEDFTSPETVLAILDRFAAETDAELQITEFDLNTLDEAAQAAYLRDFFTIIFSHPRVTGFTMWGIWEGDHWLPRAALYRKDWSPKPNGKALEELLAKTWWTDTKVTTDANGKATVKAFLGTHAVTADIAGKPVTLTAKLDEGGKPQTVTVKP